MSLPVELLVLPPLALTAGVDLYLTLLFLGVASLTGLWGDLPGSLSDLDSAGVLFLVGGFYVLEFVAERWFSGALVWNALHAVIRPLSGALLAILLLDGQPGSVVAAAAVFAGLLASFAHAARTGGSVLLWLRGSEHPSLYLVSLLEDVGTLGLLVLLLDRPEWAAAATGLAFMAGLWVAVPQTRAFVFALGLIGSRVSRLLGPRRWEDSEALPPSGRAALDHSIGAVGRLRCAPAGAHGLPGVRRFVRGWLVVSDDSRSFLYRRLGRPRVVDLAGLSPAGVTNLPFFRRIELEGPSGPRLYLGEGGPGTESLRAELGSEPGV